MTKRRNKKIRQPTAGRGKHLKTPTPPADGSSQHLHPVFSLELLGGDYCLSKCGQVERAAFADTLHKLSRMTWQQIYNSNRHKAGCEIISRDAIKSGIPAQVTEDVNLLAIRFNGIKPMVGYRDERIFYVVWLDRNCTLYNH